MQNSVTKSATEIDVPSSVGSRSVNRWRTFFLAAAIGWAVLICFGSWYPFQFSTFDWFEAWQNWRSMSWAQASKSDIAVNVLAGGPLGFTLGLAVWLAIAPRNRRWPLILMAGLGAVILLVLVSVSVEIVQAGISSRTSSWLDSAAQLAGGCFGLGIALVGQQVLRHRLDVFSTGSVDNRTHLQNRMRRLQAALDLYLAAYGIWMLVPFVPSVSPSELKEKWNSGLIQLSPFGEWFSEPWQAAYTALTASLTAIPIGCWFAIKLRANDDRRNAVTAGLAAVLCVAVLECLQLLIQTRTMGTADMVWSAIGTLIGVCATCFWIAPTTDGQHQPTKTAGFPILLMLTMVYAAMYLVLAIAPFNWIESKAEILARLDDFRANWWRNEFSGNDFGFLSNSIRTALWSLPLGALGAFTWRQSSGIFRWPIALMLLIGSVGLCCLCEGIQLMLADRDGSVVTVFVRISAVAMGALLVLMLRKRGECETDKSEIDGL